MKNDDEMYQSVLSRRDAYRLQQQKRIRTVKRLAPVLACFCFTVVLGLGFWQHRANLPQPPVKPETTETTTTSAESTPVVSESVTASPTTAQTPQITTQTEIVTQAVTSQTAQVATASTAAETTAAVQTQPATVSTQTGTSRPATAPPATARIHPPTTTAGTQPTTAVSTTAATEPIPPEPTNQEPVNIYTPPLLCRDRTELLNTLSQNDGSNYDDPEQAAYRRMIGRFVQDGFVYEVLDTDNISQIKERGVSLFPYARFEDIGVGYAVTYREAFYYVAFYSADPDILDGAAGISEYLNARMSRRTDKELDVQGRTVSAVFTGDGQILASTFVDDSHYLTVRTSAAEEALIAFLKEFQFQQTPLISDWG